jgi:hypothetical protein
MNILRVFSLIIISSFWVTTYSVAAPGKSEHRERQREARERHEEQCRERDERERELDKERREREREREKAMKEREKERQKKQKKSRKKNSHAQRGNGRSFYGKRGNGRGLQKQRGNGKSHLAHWDNGRNSYAQTTSEGRPDTHQIRASYPSGASLARLSDTLQQQHRSTTESLREELEGDRNQGIRPFEESRDTSETTDWLEFGLTSSEEPINRLDRNHTIPKEPVDIPAGIPVSNAESLMVSPHALDSGYIDTQGLSSGTEITCPFTDKPLLVP